MWFKRRLCTFKGEINEELEAHGLGLWRDEVLSGEIYSGYFFNGISIGPFLSREFKTGFAFEGILLTVFNATEDAFNLPSLYSKLKTKDRFKFELASVEASVAGSFFSHLPEATHLHLRNNITLETCLNVLKLSLTLEEHNERTDVVVYVDNGALKVEGFIDDSDSPRRDLSIKLAGGTNDEENSHSNLLEPLVSRYDRLNSDSSHGLNTHLPVCSSEDNDFDIQVEGFSRRGYRTSNVEAGKFIEVPRYFSLGRHIHLVRRMILDSKLEYLDVDCIDTTALDQNVHFLRHNYFNLNPVLLEDMTYLIKTGSRAAARPTLLRANENVYMFSQPPYHVVNID
eukprot:augustus_masked-scaffold_8-processed-gene-10.5-mRNA-1 protein AED:0.40 eAED:0.40 QI:0/0/0/0.5/1/1/2/0/340